MHRTLKLLNHRRLVQKYARLAAALIFLAAVPAFAQSIANGTYILTNKTSGFVLDDYNNSTTEGTDIDQWASNGGNGQKWTITYLGSNNNFEIINALSGYALEVYQGSTATGAAIDQWPYSGGTNQIWQIVSKGSGEYLITNAKSGLALEDPGYSTTEGEDMDQWTSSGNANQLWSLTSTTATSSNLIANGTYYITNKASGFVIDDYNNSTADGNYMDQWANNSGSNQQWTLTNLGNNYVELTNVLSGLALEVYGGSTANNGNIDQNAYSGATDQKWLIVSKGSGEYELQNDNSGLVIDDPNSSTTEGTDLIQYTASGNNNQLWAFTAVSGGSGGGGGGTPNITVNGSSSVGDISYRQLGVNLGAWASMDVKSTSPNGPNEVGEIGTKMIRWPGGSFADAYHWGGQSPYSNQYGPVECDVTNSSTDPYTYDVAGTSTDNAWGNYQSYLAKPGGYETAVTVNFGTNATCNGGGDPAEAAAWAANARSNGYNVNYWTVGNEEYGSWEDDLHYYSPANEYGGTGGHFGSVYASAMNGSSGYYQKMKAANSNAQVGAIIEIENLNASDGWNKAVLGCTNVTGATSCGSTSGGAQFDYLEVHDYQQAPGQESDSYLLNGAISSFDNSIALIRSELTATGHSVNTTLMLGEFNSVYGNPGKQSMSIVNALYVAEMYGEILKDGVNIATLWFGTGGNQNCGNNNSSSLYGWQNYGGYDLVANNVSYNWTNCGSGPNVPEGAVLPSGRAVYLANQFAHNGEHLLSNTVNSSLSNIRAYSASNGTGYNHMLINLDPNNSTSVTVGVSSPDKTSFTGTTVTYGKAQYDNSKNNVWTGPVTQSLGTVGSTVTITLPPYSITVLEME